MKIILLTLLFIYSPLMANTDLQQLSRSERIPAIFNQLNKDTMHLVYEFYDKDVEFKDPVIALKGVDNMRRHYEHQYQNVQSIRFDFNKEVVSGDTHVVFWTMHLTAKNLNGGKSIAVEGNSHIIFGGTQDKVIYHRDYFDMGEFIYEKVPVLGFIIKKIKSLLSFK